MVPEELWVRKLERDIDSLSVAQVREVSQDKKLKGAFKYYVSMFLIIWDPSSYVSAVHTD